MDLTDEQWCLIEPLILLLPCRADDRSCPRRNPREVMSRIPWIVHAGPAWADMPSRYLPGSTCHRFQTGVKDGVFIEILNSLAEDLYTRR